MFQLSAARADGHLSYVLSGGDCSQAGLVSGTLLPPLGGQRYCNAASASRVGFSAEVGRPVHLKCLHQGCQTAAFKHSLQLISEKRDPVGLTVIRTAL